jgi:prevent-host-death family protein
MRTFNIHAAKTQLSRLIDEVAAGEPFVIAKAGKPMARVIPISAPKKKVKKRIGFMKGAYTLPDDFDEIDKQLDKEIGEMFYGKDAK